MLYDATVMQGEPLTPTPIAVAYEWFLDVQIGDIERIVLDELTPRFDDIAHQPGENLVGNVSLRDLNPKQRAVRRIESGFPQLLRIHLAKALVAGDGKTPATGSEDRVEQL